MWPSAYKCAGRVNVSVLHRWGCCPLALQGKFTGSHCNLASDFLSWSKSKSDSHGTLILPADFPQTFFFWGSQSVALTASLYGLHSLSILGTAIRALNKYVIAKVSLLLSMLLPIQKPTSFLNFLQLYSCFLWRKWPLSMLKFLSGNLQSL